MLQHVNLMKLLFLTRCDKKLPVACYCWTLYSCSFIYRSDDQIAAAICWHNPVEKKHIIAAILFHTGVPHHSETKSIVPCYKAYPSQILQENLSSNHRLTEKYTDKQTDTLTHTKLIKKKHIIAAILFPLWSYTSLQKPNQLFIVATQLNSTLLWHACSWTAEQLDC